MSTPPEASAAGAIGLAASGQASSVESPAAVDGRTRSAGFSVRLPLQRGRIVFSAAWQPLALEYSGSEKPAEPVYPFAFGLGELVKATWRYLFNTVPWFAVIAGLATVVTAGMLVNTLTGSPPRLEQAAAGRGRTLLLLLALLSVSSFALFKLRFKLVGIRLLAHRDARARRGLILFVSTANLPLVFGRRGAEVGGVVLSGSSLKSDTEALSGTVDGAGREKLWNWQQLLRAIRPHGKKLDFLYLFGSVESQDQIRLVARLLAPYLRDRHTILLSPAGVDFEDLDAVMDGLKDAVSWLEARGLPRREILIDVTGGQKTASIAGALMSLNNRVNIQYVQTFGKDKNKVLEYDAEVSAPALA
jgi:hypothetical protein